MFTEEGRWRGVQFSVIKDRMLDCNEKQLSLIIRLMDKFIKENENE